MFKKNVRLFLINFQPPCMVVAKNNVSLTLDYSSLVVSASEIRVENTKMMLCQNVNMCNPYHAEIVA